MNEPRQYALDVMRILCNLERAQLTFSEAKLYIKELEDLLESEDDFIFEFEGVDHRIIAKHAIDEIWHRELVELLEECYSDSIKVGGLPQILQEHISVDWESMAEVCKQDGLGHHFNHYDGSEIDSQNHYIFRLDA